MQEKDPFKRIIQIEDIKEKTAEFLKYKQHFSLGELETESFHPHTMNFSQTIQQSTKEGIKLLKQVDHDLFQKQIKYFDEILFLGEEIVRTVQTGGSIFLVGCGATGRLSILAEAINRNYYQKNFAQPIHVHSIMAGGDYAFIKSVEAFEDSFTFSIQQLKEKNFSHKDLCIGITEGGETTFVLSAIKYASEICQRYPFYLFCNPHQQLQEINRSAEILSNDKIHKLYLETGPMAISGSTRMQATSSQLLVVLEALEFAYAKLNHQETNASRLEQHWINRVQRFQELDYMPLLPLIEEEAQMYEQNGLVTYQSDTYCALSVMTDTTERSPTFCLLPFASIKEDHHSWVYLTIKDRSPEQNVWAEILGRPACGLEWDHIRENISTQDILNFDLSHQALYRRSQRLQHLTMEIWHQNDTLNFSTQNNRVLFHNFNQLIFDQIGMKILLNTLSTSVMGKLGRVEGNMMTFVKPSNCKLVDRSIRYAKNILWQNHHRKVPYEELAERLFQLMDFVSEKKPIVELMVESVLAGERKEVVKK